MDKSSWVDILPPVTPGDSHAMLILSAVSALFVLFVLILFLWRNMAQQRSIKKLDNLLDNLPDASEYKKIPLQISHIFKQHFNVVNIAYIAMPGQADWSNFKDRLNEACFSKEIPPQQELEELLLESRYWLKQQAAKND